MVGQRITNIRENKGISADELAQRCKLNITQIKSIEEGQVLPSLAPLIKIARVLGVRLGTFLDDSNAIAPVVTRNKKEEGISFSNSETTTHSTMQYQSLAHNKAGRHMEPFIIDVKPSSDDYQFSQHEGEEFLYVLEGDIEIVYGTEKYQLSKGESIYYDSIVGHHVHAMGNKDAKILATVYIPM